MTPSPQVTPTPATLSDREARTELRALAAARHATLPAAARTATQVAGVAGIACGATHGVLERCNFACTSCYLTEAANAVPPLPFAEVAEQLDALRRHLGPGGKAQITSGEVTLLPVEELGRIVLHARAIGLDPMVMTNGARMLDEPDYLERLVRDFGLRKVSVHIDVTQHGRRELRPGMREADLHPLRDRFADLVRAVRAATGARLHAAQTITVTPDNLDDVPDVVRWSLTNADAFRLISFQPAADVGRTRDRRPADDVMTALWDRICQAAGRRLNRHAMHFGHPECNITVPLGVVSLGDRREVFELVREGAAGDERAMQGAIRTLGTRLDIDASPLRTAVGAAATLLRHPGVLARLAGYGVRRAVSDARLGGAIARAALTGQSVRAHPQLFVVHRFMDADELRTPLGRERLDACVFKVPVDGAMVSMCEVNATGIRRRLNESARRRDPTT